MSCLQHLSQHSWVREGGKIIVCLSSRSREEFLLSRSVLSCVEASVSSARWIIARRRLIDAKKKFADKQRHRKLIKSSSSGINLYLTYLRFTSICSTLTCAITRGVSRVGEILLIKKKWRFISWTAKRGVDVAYRRRWTKHGRARSVLYRDGYCSKASDWGSRARERKHLAIRRRKPNWIYECFVLIFTFQLGKPRTFPLWCWGHNSPVGQNKLTPRSVEKFK